MMTAELASRVEEDLEARKCSREISIARIQRTRKIFIVTRQRIARRRASTSRRKALTRTRAASGKSPSDKGGSTAVNAKHQADKRAAIREASAGRQRGIGSKRIKIEQAPYLQHDAGEPRARRRKTADNRAASTCRRAWRANANGKSGTARKKHSGSTLAKSENMRYAAGDVWQSAQRRHGSIDAGSGAGNGGTIKAPHATRGRQAGNGQRIRCGAGVDAQRAGSGGHQAAAAGGRASGEHSGDMAAEHARWRAKRRNQASSAKCKIERICGRIREKRQRTSIGTLARGSGC